MHKLSALLAAALIALVGSAQANSITITGFDGVSTVTNTASSPVNFGPTSVGNWTASGQATGTPPLQSGTLFSNTLDINTGGPGTFTLWVTETGLMSPIGAIPWLSSLTTNLLFGGITSVTETTSLQSDNSTPGPLVPLGVILDTATFTTDNQVQEATLAAATGVGPYSITEQYVVDATGAGGANLTIDMTAVPEPSSLMILGTALAGLGWLMRRRRNGGAAI